MKDLRGALEALSLNSPLQHEIDRILRRAVGNFVARRDGGASASMNPSLDYTSCTILDEVREALDIPRISPKPPPG